VTISISTRCILPAVTRGRTFGLVVLALAVALVVAAVAVAAQKGTLGGSPTVPVGPPDEGTRESPVRVILAGDTWGGGVEIAAYKWNPPAEFATGADMVWADVEIGSPPEGWLSSSTFSPEELAAPVAIEALFWQPSPKSERSTFVGGALQPGVARVQLSYKRPHGTGTVHADAVVGSVNGRLQEEIGQAAPFGYFFARLPGVVQAKGLQAVAFDADGNRLGSTRGKAPLRP
jgi:hypothetical protein